MLTYMSLLRLVVHMARKYTIWLGILLAGRASAPTRSAYCTYMNPQVTLQRTSNTVTQAPYHGPAHAHTAPYRSVGHPLPSTVPPAVPRGTHCATHYDTVVLPPCQRLCDVRVYRRAGSGQPAHCRQRRLETALAGRPSRPGLARLSERFTCGRVGLFDCLLGHDLVNGARTRP
jgi:hypothetical protein